MYNFSLTTRIIFSFICIAVLAYLLLVNPLVDRVERQYLEAAEEPMVDTAHILAGLLSSQIKADQVLPVAVFSEGMVETKTRVFEANIYNFLKRQVAMDFYVTDDAGVVVYDSGGMEAVGNELLGRRDVFMTLRGKYGARSTRVNEQDPHSSVMYVAAPIVVDERIVGVLSVYKPQQSLHFFIDESKRRLWLLGALAILIFLLFGILLSRWVTYPLQRLTDYAAAVSRGERLVAPQMPGRHLRVLGETTEAMREALENRKYVESYVQSMTHEMKSPVAGILGSAELLQEDLPEAKRQQFVQNIQSESRRLQSLIDQLLALSSIENRQVLGSPVLFSLSALAQRVAHNCQGKSMEKQVTCRVYPLADDSVLGEEFLLETAISNLVQNAIDFSRIGGAVEIALAREGKTLRLRVSDEGEGIPAFAVDRIFDRFYSLPRPGSNRKSSGLGLCFVREAILLHQGSVEVRNRPQATGVQADICLPVHR